MADDKAEKDVIVLDNGGGWVKAGWAGEDRPRVSIPNVMRATRAAGGEDGQFEEGGGGGGGGGRRHLVGSAALSQRSRGAGDRKADRGAGDGGDDAGGEDGAGKQGDDSASDGGGNGGGGGEAVYPVSRGVVTDWDALERVWEHVFETELRAGATDDYSLVVTVSPLATAETRKKMAELAFRKFKMPSVCIVNSAVMSLYSTGRTRGLVLEIGDGLASAVPVFEGFALPHAARQIQLAGADLTQYLMKRLSSRGSGARFDSSHVQTVRAIKEKLCALSPQPFVSGAHHRASRPEGGGGDDADDGHLLYELPDGQTIRIDSECRFGVAEALFRPKDVGVQAPGIAQLVYEAVRGCDSYLQADLLANVVVAGGTSMMAGLGERLRSELQRTCAEFGCPINVVLDSQRRNAAWIGASMYGSLPTYDQIKITRQEYHDAGDAVVLRKCF